MDSVDLPSTDMKSVVYDHNFNFSKGLMTPKKVIQLPEQAVQKSSESLIQEKINIELSEEEKPKKNKLFNYATIAQGNLLAVSNELKNLHNKKSTTKAFREL